MGDGEQQEGQVWEAAQFAPNKKLGNLTAVIDYNLAQIDGKTEYVNDNRDLAAKYRAFGWHIDEMQGNDMNDVIRTLKKAQENPDVPTLILMHTEMGYGVDYMVGNYKWHGVAPNAEQVQQAMNQLPLSVGFSDY
jgi:transketolase